MIKNMRNNLLETPNEEATVMLFGKYKLYGLHYLSINVCKIKIEDFNECRKIFGSMEGAYIFINPNTGEAYDGIGEQIFTRSYGHKGEHPYATHVLMIFDANRPIEETHRKLFEHNIFNYLKERGYDLCVYKDGVIKREQSIPQLPINVNNIIGFERGFERLKILLDLVVDDPNVNHKNFDKKSQNKKQIDLRSVELSNSFAEVMKQIKLDPKCHDTEITNRGHATRGQLATFFGYLKLQPEFWQNAVFNPRSQTGALLLIKYPGKINIHIQVSSAKKAICIYIPKINIDLLNILDNYINSGKIKTKYGIDFCDENNSEIRRRSKDYVIYEVNISGDISDESVFTEHAKFLIDRSKKLRNIIEDILNDPLYKNDKKRK